MGKETVIESVMVTGATGFVGRYVVRELLARGYKPICVVRSPGKLFGQHPDVSSDRITAIAGSLSDLKAMRHAADLSQAVIHLVGIIIERRLKGQTFRGIHVAGTNRVVNAAETAGIKRFVHMSALGSRRDGVSRYHQTKWQGEGLVRDSGLDWTIFRPSLIHGPDGEFMQLMKAFACDLLPPIMPYFGSGEAKVQPVFVKDVARCLVDALHNEKTIGKTIPLGGPRVYSWIGLYNACRTRIPGARPWKPLVAQPVPLAELVATFSGPPMALAELLVPSLRKFRFDRGQVRMSQEDSVCDHTTAEALFGLKMRDFETELSDYADRLC
ncbi:MAG: NAD(P)H-binding protein [Planctomycetes bacterium]|nr:NAD(P)H-binding protein [Planctomycetota bacterium]